MHDDTIGDPVYVENWHLPKFDYKKQNRIESQKSHKGYSLSPTGTIKRTNKNKTVKASLWWIGI